MKAHRVLERITCIYNVLRWMSSEVRPLKSWPGEEEVSGTG